jgi:hypothetical protein
MGPQTPGTQVPASSYSDLSAVVEALNALGLNTERGEQDTTLEAGCCFSCSGCGWWCWSCGTWCETCDQCAYCYSCAFCFSCS